MRRIRLAALALLAAAVLGAVAWNAGAGPGLSAADSVVVIGDKRFALQLEDMAVNMRSYEGRTVRVAGFTLPLGRNAPWRFAVARNFYCCGTDSYPVGLPCEYARETPETDAWIEVEGTFRIDEQERPYLEIVTLTVKDAPGQREVFS